MATVVPVWLDHGIARRRFDAADEAAIPKGSPLDKALQLRRTGGGRVDLVALLPGKKRPVRVAELDR